MNRVGLVIVWCLLVPAGAAESVKTVIPTDAPVVVHVPDVMAVRAQLARAPQGQLTATAWGTRLLERFAGRLTEIDDSYPMHAALDSVTAVTFGAGVATDDGPDFLLADVRVADDGLWRQVADLIAHPVRENLWYAAVTDVRLLRIAEGHWGISVGARRQAVLTGLHDLADVGSVGSVRLRIDLAGLMSLMQIPVVPAGGGAGPSMLLTGGLQFTANGSWEWWSAPMVTGGPSDGFRPVTHAEVVTAPPTALYHVVAALDTAPVQALANAASGPLALAMHQALQPYGVSIDVIADELGDRVAMMIEQPDGLVPAPITTVRVAMGSALADKVLPALGQVLQLTDRGERMWSGFLQGKMPVSLGHRDGQLLVTTDPKGVDAVAARWRGATADGAFARRPAIAKAVGWLAAEGDPGATMALAVSDSAGLLQLVARNAAPILQVQLGNQAADLARDLGSLEVAGYQRVQLTSAGTVINRSGGPVGGPVGFYTQWMILGGYLALRDQVLAMINARAVERMQAPEDAPASVP